MEAQIVLASSPSRAGVDKEEGAMYQIKANVCSRTSVQGSCLAATWDHDIIIRVSRLKAAHSGPMLTLNSTLV